MYLVTLDNEEVGVQLREKARGVWEAELNDGSQMELELKGRDEDGNFVIRINGADHKVSLRQNGALELVDGDTAHAFEIAHAADVVLDELGARTADRQVDTTLRSPITGIVLEILVEPGQQVEPGAPMIVVEAMKMENTLGAPCAGRVQTVEVEAGTTVFVGDVLVELEQ